MKESSRWKAKALPPRSVSCKLGRGYSLVLLIPVPCPSKRAGSRHPQLLIQGMRSNSRGSSVRTGLLFLIPALPFVPRPEGEHLTSTFSQAHCMVKGRDLGDHQVQLPAQAGSPTAGCPGLRYDPTVPHSFLAAGLCWYKLPDRVV